MHKHFRFFVLGLLLTVWSTAVAQNVPELMYYKFDESGGSATQNFANPGVGLNPAPLTGQTMGGTGQFGSALIGTGVANNFVNTGWTTALGTGSWTISMWLNNLPSNTSLFYLWGDNTAGSFRSFLGGAAGAGNVTLRVTNLADCIVTGVAPGPTVVTYVYDASANQVRGYKNGVLAVTATPTAPLNINGTGATPFRVGAYSTSTGLPSGGLMDEFRMYNRALDASEIALTWNQPLPLGTPGWSQQTSGITTALYTVKAVTPQIAWTAGAGGVVLRTTNGGNTWTSVGGGNLGTSDLYNITALDATTALTTTSTTTTTYIFRTTNGGTSWDTVFVQPGGFINAIHMFDANNGIAQGDPVGGTWTIIRTTNGGASWARIATEPTQVGGEYGANNGMKVIGTNNIWFTPGTGNGFYYSTNGGTTWTRVTLPASGFTAGIDFVNTQYGVVGNNAGAAARTTNGGATWTPVTVGTSGAIYAVGAAGTLNFWAMRGTSFLKSRDRGATWAQEYTDATAGIIWHTSFVTSGANVFGWAVTGTGKIYAYFNPADFHDLSMVSLGAAPITRPTSPARSAPQSDEQSVSADYATASAEGSDERHDAVITLSPIPSSVHALADTMRFRAIVKNLGTFNEPSYQIGWTIDGVAQTTINRGAIASGALDTVILQWNQATTGAHTVRAWATIPDDANRANDTATYSFTFTLDRGTWTSLPPSPNALSRSCVAYIRIADTGYVYQFGGGAGTQLNSVARFNTVTNTWSNTGFASMPLAVSAGTAITVGDSNIYVFGGENAAATLGSTQRYNVYTNTWTTLATMPTPVTDAAVVKYNDSLIYVIGGGNGLFGTVVNSAVQLYNVRTNTYTAATPYPLAAAMMGVGIFNDTIIVSGGWNGTGGNPNSYKGIINPANPTQITWTLLPPYPLAGGITRMASATLRRGTGVGVLFAGGAIGGATLTAKAYLWNFCTGVWSPLDTFAVPRSNMKAASDGGATAYVIAGFTTAGVGTSDKFTLTNIEGTCGATVGADSLLVILHDSTVGTPTNQLKRRADRDTLLTYLRQMVPNHRVAYMADSNATTLPDFSNYKMILYQETSFDDAVVRFLGGTARQALKNWLNGGTPTNRRRFILIGADVGWNYSRLGSTARDTVLAHDMLKFAYILDNGNVSGQNSITGVTVNPGQVFAYTTSPPGAGFWPDGCRPQSGSAVLYKYTGRGETDTVAGIGYSAPGYVAASLFQDPRYFTGTFGPVLASLLHYTGIVTDVEEPELEVPSNFALLQNYPNPFNPSTTIRYALPAPARVNLAIYNMLGQRVAELVDEVQAAGHQAVVWNGRNQAGTQVASGVYFYRLEAQPTGGGAPFINVKKMVLLK